MVVLVFRRYKKTIWTYHRLQIDYFTITDVTLHEENSKGDIGSPGSLQRLLRGLAIQRAQKRDEFITVELTNHLFQSGCESTSTYYTYAYFTLHIHLVLINQNNHELNFVQPFRLASIWLP